MRPAAIGAIVTISPYDWYDRDHARPDSTRKPATHIRSVGLRGGTVYEIVSIRQVTPRGSLPRGCVARYHVRAIKLGDSSVAMASVPPEARVISLRWNDRRRRVQR